MDINIKTQFCFTLNQDDMNILRFLVREGKNSAVRLVEDKELTKIENFADQILDVAND